MALQARHIDTGETVDLDASVFGDTFHMQVVYEAARAEANARRQGTAATKTRGEVSMSGGKAWRQKGTGRARAGALSTPQRTGGGVAFGPRPRRYTVKINRKAHRRALRSALSMHAERGTLGVADAGSYEQPSTKRAAENLRAFGTGSALVVIADGGDETLAKSFRNLGDVGLAAVDDVGVVDVLSASRLVVSTRALERLIERAAHPSTQREVAA